MKDFIVNGVGHGSIAAKLLATDFNIGALRPFVDEENGRTYIAVNQTPDNPKGQVMAVNDTGTLRKDEWNLLDHAVTRVAKERLRVVGNLRGAGLTRNIPNGMRYGTMETQRMGDITTARFSMDALADSESDRLEFDVVGLPLPIVHKQFTISARQLSMSRNGGAPLDTLMAEAATRRCAEEIEKLHLGTNTYTFGGYSAYGFKNFPYRETYTVTAPTAGGWTPTTLVEELLDMRQELYDNYHFGPYALLFAPAWSKYLDEDYSAAKGTNTLRQRIMAVEDFSSLTTVDHLTNYDIIMYEQSREVVETVTGMEFTTVQWETKGGLALNFMVMGIMVPHIRCDINNNSGIQHASVA